MLLLLVLAALIGGLVAFDGFRKDVHASNRRVPASTKRALAPSSDVLSKPQLVLIVFDRASLFARTDPDRGLISLLSVPGDVHLRRAGGRTVGDVLGTTGATGLVRFVRSGVGLDVTHVALLGPHDIAPLVEAIGGIRIRDASIGRGDKPAGTAFLDGAEADRYLASAGGPSSLTRRERERALLEAVFGRLASVASLSKLPNLARTFSATVATDLSPRDTLGLAVVRLRSTRSVQCGIPASSAFEQPHNRQMLREFLGLKATPEEQRHIFPSSGCSAAALSQRAPLRSSSWARRRLGSFHS